MRTNGEKRQNLKGIKLILPSIHSQLHLNVKYRSFDIYTEKLTSTPNR